MSLLASYLLKATTAEEAVLSFVKDMTKKYPPIGSGSPMETVLKYNWKINYFTGNTSVLYGLLVAWIMPHLGILIREGQKTLRFSTYHSVHKQLALQIGWMVILKHVLIRISVLSMASFMMMAGLCIIMLIIMLWDPPRPVVALFGDGRLNVLFFLACFSLPSYLCAQLLVFSKRLGLPPGTGDEFRHRIIALTGVEGDPT